MVKQISNEREFRKACESAGFSCLGTRFYARCIGDGVLQTIYTGEKQYLDPFSQAYSSLKRKSYSIDIGLRSMYSEWKYYGKNTSPHMGGYAPHDFLVGTKSRIAFNGIEEQYLHMVNGCFDALDSISTQRKLLEFKKQVDFNRHGTVIHDIEFVPALLLCGEANEAFNELSNHYTHCCIGFQKTYSNVLKNGDTDAFLEKYIELNERLSTTAFLWEHIMTRKMDPIRQYLCDNFSRNMMWIRSNNVPYPAGLETIYF